MPLSEADKLKLALALLRDIRRRLTPVLPESGERPPEQTRRVIVNDIRLFLKEIEKP